MDDNYLIKLWILHKILKFCACICLNNTRNSNGCFIQPKWEGTSTAALFPCLIATAALVLNGTLFAVTIIGSTCNENANLPVLTNG